MYECNLCKTEATVNHTDKPKLNCACENAKVVVNIDGHAYGNGSLNARSGHNNNLTEQSAVFIKQMMSMVLGVEFFQENKESIFANEVVIEDSTSGRKFSFTLTAKEL